MKKLAIVLGLLALINSSLHARVLQREVEGEAPIEVTTPVTVIDEVGEYKYEGADKKYDQYDYKADRTFQEGIETLAKKSEPQKSQSTNSDANKKEEFVVATTQEVVKTTEELETGDETEVVFRPVPVENTIVIEKEELAQAYYPDKKGDMYLGLSFGVANTRYDLLDDNLTKGSWKSEVSLFKMVNAQNAFGLSQSFLHAQDSDMVVENTTMSITKLFVQRSKFLRERVYIFGMMGLSFADYNIRRVVYENENLITYKKVKSGFAVGIAPEIGFRYMIQNGIYADLSVEYSVFFGRDNGNLGDFAIRPRLNMSF